MTKLLRQQYEEILQENVSLRSQLSDCTLAREQAEQKAARKSKVFRKLSEIIGPRDDETLEGALRRIVGEREQLEAELSALREEPAGLAALSEALCNIGDQDLSLADEWMQRATAAEAALAEAVKALTKIEKWFGEFPDTGQEWDDGKPMSYGAAFGSNGERDFMRDVARKALTAIEAAFGENDETR